MRAGILKYSITFLYSQLTKDAFGSETENWIVYNNVRAAIIYKGGNKSIVDNEMFNSSSIDFNIRYDENINEQMRIVYKNKIYKINAINPNPYDNSLIVSAELIVGLTYSTTTTTLPITTTTTTI